MSVKPENLTQTSKGLVLVRISVWSVFSLEQWLLGMLVYFRIRLVSFYQSFGRER